MHFQSLFNILLAVLFELLFLETRMVKACYAKFNADIPTSFNLDALQHLPTEFSLNPHLPNNLTLTARIPTKYSIDPNIPNNFTIHAELPTDFSLNPNLPNNFTFSINLPNNFSLDPNLPSDFTIQGIIPTNYSIDANIPTKFTFDFNIPSDFSFTLVLPDSLSQMVQFLGYVGAAYIAVLAANLLLKFLKDFCASLKELVSVPIYFYRSCTTKSKSGYKEDNLKRNEINGLLSPSAPLKRGSSPSKERLFNEDDLV